VSFTNILIFLLASIISLIGIIAINVWYHCEKDLKLMESYGNTTLNSIDNSLKDMSRVSLVCFSDKRTQQILREYDQHSYGEQLEDVKYLQEFYTSMIIIRDDVKGIYMFNQDSLIFNYDTNNPGKKKDINTDEFLTKIKSYEDDSGEGISGCSIFIGELPDFMRYKVDLRQNKYQNFCIYLVRSIRSFSPHEVIGHIAMYMPVEKMKILLEEYKETGNEYILLDQQNQIVCANNEQSIGKLLKDEFPKISEQINGFDRRIIKNEDGTRILVSFKESSYSGMKIITIRSLSLIFKEIKYLVLYCGLIVSVSAVLALICVFLGTRKQLKRITDFANSLNTFTPTNLSRRYPVDKEDEVGRLKAAVNYMMDIIDNLVVSEYQSKMKLQEAQLQEQKLSMLYLKNQVNPHFLYNTLDVIRMKAGINGDQEIAKMLMDLVAFYRLSTRIDDSFVTVEHEVEMLKAYMNLMTYRYPNLNYSIEVEKGLESVKIPNFMLQPLVENSLLHGLKDRGYKGFIKLKINYSENMDELKIQIIDDGVGMPETMLNKINGMLLGEDEQEDIHIGIANVKSRLQMLYGKNYKMEFGNHPSGGLRVDISLGNRK